MNDRLRIMQRQPRRISITLSYHVHESLLQRSEEEGRSMSNLCAFLLEDALRHQNNQPLLPLGAQSAVHNGHEHRLRQRSPF
jgi:macrodomain Ter protein organizer (MatP/YcbG family)